MKNLALLADVAAVPSAYDAEALVSVLVGYLIQAGIPEPGLTRMMLDVIDELRRRDADHSYPATRPSPLSAPACSSHAETHDNFDRDSPSARGYGQPASRSPLACLLPGEHALLSPEGAE